MAGSSSNARQIAYDRLVKRIERFRPRNDTASVFKEISQYLLEVNPSDGTHNKASIEKDLSANLPSQHTVFTRDNFDRGGYAILLLREVSNFFGIHELDPRLADLVDVALRDNPTFMAYVWLAAVYDRAPSIGKLVLAFREARNAPNPFAMGTDPNSTPITDRRMTETIAAEHQGPNTAASIAPSHHINEDHVPSGPTTPQSRFPAGAGQQTLTWDPALNTPLPNRYPTKDTSKKASSVSMYFRDTRFSGEKSQCVRHTIRDYEACTHQFELSTEQKTKIFVNVFSGPAREFFFENTHPHMRYEELVKVVLDEYDNDARQLAAQSELERFTFDQAMEEVDSKSLDAGLSCLVDKINVLTPQASPEFRSEEHKEIFLRKAVLHATWASTPIAQMTTARFTFNRFVTALREQI